MKSHVIPMLFLPALLLPASSTAANESAAVQSSAGTYQLAICKRRPCSTDDTTNVVVSGTLVLSDTSYKTVAFPDSVRFHLLRPVGPNERNGCSATGRRRPAPQTYAAIGGVDLIAWKQETPNTIAVRMHYNSGVYYDLRGTLRGDQLTGTGKSAGESSAVPSYPDDIVVAKRIGPPDHKPCADSAMAIVRARKR